MINEEIEILVYVYNKAVDIAKSAFCHWDNINIIQTMIKSSVKDKYAFVNRSGDMFYKHQKAKQGVRKERIGENDE